MENSIPKFHVLAIRRGTPWNDGNTIEFDATKMWLETRKLETRNIKSTEIVVYYFINETTGEFNWMWVDDWQIIINP